LFDQTLEDGYVLTRDGTRIAYTLHRPVTDDPVPALLEALPYRKDDMLERSVYERFATEFGFAVCRVDVRGTGSSSGRASDEYPAEELDDLADVIGWLADQPWSNGNVGMFGWSYSGFNSLQVAAERPPALKAIVPIYSSDDRYTDDVHKMGGVLRLLDLVDYPAYLVASNALPPVPELWGEGWREEWRQRVELNEPWLLRWIAEQRPDYWAAGSLRPDYARIQCPTMIVAGWADGYRNNTFRTVRALAEAGTPWKLVIGPWSHMAAERSRPGPWVDMTAVMARWFDRWLRGIDNGIDREPPIAVFQRASERPEPDRETVSGTWRAHEVNPLDAARPMRLPLGEGTVRHVVAGDVGTAAWNSCAGDLPWGQPTDQRYDDAASLTWDWPVGGLAVTGEELPLVGHPRLRLRVRADRPVAFVSAKLCDVFPDGTSALLTRGVLNLSYRDDLHGRPQALVPGEWVEVDLELEAVAWTLAAGQRLRLAVTGTDWPNVAAPPGPVELEIDRASSHLVLPVLDGVDRLPDPGLPEPPRPELGDGDGVGWTIERDVLGRTTTCRTRYGETWKSRRGYACSVDYQGAVSIDRRSFAQTAAAVSTFEATYDGVHVRTESRLEVRIDATHLEVEVALEALADGQPFASNSWRRRIARDLA
jgi:predicted acyl esterase